MKCLGHAIRVCLSVCLLMKVTSSQFRFCSVSSRVGYACSGVLSAIWKVVEVEDKDRKSPCVLTAIYWKSSPVRGRISFFPMEENSTCGKKAISLWIFIAILKGLHFHTIRVATNSVHLRIFFVSSCWPTRDWIGRSTGNYNPVTTSSAGGAKGCSDHRFCERTPSLHCHSSANSASTQSQQPVYRTANQI